MPADHPRLFCLGELEGGVHFRLDGPDNIHGRLLIVVSIQEYVKFIARICAKQ